MTSPDPTLPEERTPRGSVVREVIGLLLLLTGIAGVLVVAFDVDTRAGALVLSVLVAFIGWRMTIAEE